MNRPTHALVLLTWWCWAPVAQAQQQPDPGGGSRPTAERIRQELERDRPKPEPLAPAEGPSAGPRPAEPEPRPQGLLPEDYPIASAEGSLHKIDDNWRFVFSEEQQWLDKPMVVLQNSQLDKMVRYALGSGKDIHFSVSGFVTEYHGANYLMVRDVAILRATRPPQDAPPTPTPAADAGGTDELIQAIQQRSRQKELLQEQGPPPPSALRPIGDAARGLRRIWREDDQEEDRLGRLIQQEGHWLFAFHSYSDEAGDPPIVLLPNLALQEMQRLSDNGARRMLFRVTGVMTEYAGRNYMLVRRFTIRRTHGNLQ